MDRYRELLSVDLPCLTNPEFHLPIQSPVKDVRVEDELRSCYQLSQESLQAMLKWAYSKWGPIDDNGQNTKSKDDPDISGLLKDLNTLSFEALEACSNVMAAQSLEPIDTSNDATELIANYEHLAHFCYLLEKIQTIFASLVLQKVDSDTFQAQIHTLLILGQHMVRLDSVVNPQFMYWNIILTLVNNYTLTESTKLFLRKAIYMNMVRINFYNYHIWELLYPVIQSVDYVFSSTLATKKCLSTLLSIENPETEQKLIETLISVLEYCKNDPSTEQFDQVLYLIKLWTQPSSYPESRIQWLLQIIDRCSAMFESGTNIFHFLKRLKPKDRAFVLFLRMLTTVLKEKGTFTELEFASKTYQKLLKNLLVIFQDAKGEFTIGVRELVNLLYEMTLNYNVKTEVAPCLGLLILFKEDFAIMFTSIMLQFLELNARSMSLVDDYTSRHSELKDNNYCELLILAILEESSFLNRTKDHCIEMTRLINEVSEPEAGSGPTYDLYMQRKLAYIMIWLGRNDIEFVDMINDDIEKPSTLTDCILAMSQLQVYVWCIGAKTKLGAKIEKFDEWYDVLYKKADVEEGDEEESAEDQREEKTGEDSGIRVNNGEIQRLNKLIVRSGLGESPIVHFQTRFKIKAQMRDHWLYM